ncbi:MAG TPA: oxaloacetate decarboxylase [Clostridiales bacterium]|nr:oxaloacetate decarboxylase [Clostridiales bacterium]
MYIDNFTEVLPKLVYGYLGIFIVTVVIIGITIILNKVTEKK